MKKSILTSIILLIISGKVIAQHNPDKLIPVRAIALAAPNPEKIDVFTAFIQNELIPRKVNTLILRVDYKYQFKTHPELIDEQALSEKDVKKIVNVCKAGGIRIIPQVNLFGHQSWFENVGKLLEVYPQFNETPDVPLEKGVKWPNKWGLYCLSYCPLHPDLHPVIFDVIDEIVGVFETDAFHAGMDEIFYIGMDERCKGIDPAKLFADEVTRISNHLALQNKRLWIWGDRLIDGKTTGLGMWEASMNNTHRAIDMIPKTVVINDWHYERADPTAAYFALKGFDVVTCTWRKPEVALNQLDLLLQFRSNATEATKDRYLGMMLTVWTSTENFIDQFYGRKTLPEKNKGDWVQTFKQLFDEISVKIHEK